MATAQQIFKFSRAFIENIQVLDNGNLLLTTMQASDMLYVLDPKESEPKARPIATNQFGNTTALSGMVSLAPDLYAITGGIHTSFSFKRDSMYVYLVSLEDRNEKVVDKIHVPDTATLNGMAWMPGQPTKLLSADSIDGRIFQIDTVSKEVSVLLEDPALAPPENARFPIGINGIRTHGDHVYFTNSAKQTFARFRIDYDKNNHKVKLGDIEILAESLGPKHIFDDFIFDDRKNAYIAAHSTSVIKITPDGEQTVFAGGGDDSILQEPTSAAMAKDGRSVYVCTGGAIKDGVWQGGQVVQIQLEK